VVRRKLFFCKGFAFFHVERVFRPAVRAEARTHMNASDIPIFQKNFGKQLRGYGCSQSQAIQSGATGGDADL
jgi:hypothetical protein